MEPYLALFEPDHNAGGYVVTFPDFGYGVTQGETDEEAMEMAQDLLMLTIGDYIRESRPLPLPKRHRDSKFRSVALPALQAAKVDLYGTFSGVGPEEGGTCPSDRDSEDPHRTLIFSPAPLPPESNRSGLCRARQRLHVEARNAA
jgi:antitoxin HicB